MTVSELQKELDKFKGSQQVLIFPEGIDDDEEGNEELLPGGIGVFDGKEVKYIGDVQFLQELYDDDEMDFDLDDEDDDELDVEFEEERMN